MNKYLKGKTMGINVLNNLKIIYIKLMEDNFFLEPKLHLLIYVIRIY